MSILFTMFHYVVIKFTGNTTTVHNNYLCLRCLSPGGVLFKLTVMDSKVGTKITAVSQWTDGAGKKGTGKI